MALGLRGGVDDDAGGQRPAVDELGLHPLRGHARRVLEHQPPADRPHHDEPHHAGHAGDPQSPLLGGPEPRAAPEFPAEHRGEDDHRDQGQPLVPLHQIVDGGAVVDRLLGQLAGDDRRPAADHAGPQGPEARGPERLPPRDPGGQVEEDCDDEQRRWQVVQRGVQARGVVAEHGRVISSLWGMKGQSPRLETAGGSTE